MMNFNDMLKKKKKDHMETTDNVENIHDENTTSAEDQDNPIEETDGETLVDEKAIKAAEDLFKEELSLANDKYLRLYAEFDNFRRRTSKERVELLQTAGKEVIVSMLPVLDDFERALKFMDSATDIVAVKEGVALVQQKLKSILAQKGLKELQSKGMPFDADLHEAITNIPAPTSDLKGKVVDELEKGYALNDKVVRFAKVVVGS
jgi:molecular chaperone GrpE